MGKWSGFFSLPCERTNTCILRPSMRASLSVFSSSPFLSHACGFSCRSLSLYLRRCHRSPSRMSIPISLRLPMRFPFPSLSFPTLPLRSTCPPFSPHLLFLSLSSLSLLFFPFYSFPSVPLASLSIRSLPFVPFYSTLFPFNPPFRTDPSPFKPSVRTLLHHTVRHGGNQAHEVRQTMAMAMARRRTSGLTRSRATTGERGWKKDTRKGACCAWKCDSSWCVRRSGPLVQRKRQGSEDVRG